MHSPQRNMAASLVAPIAFAAAPRVATRQLRASSGAPARASPRAFVVRAAADERQVRAGVRVWDAETILSEKRR